MYNIFYNYINYIAPAKFLFDLPKILSKQNSVPVSCVRHLSFDSTCVTILSPKCQCSRRVIHHFKSRQTEPIKAFTRDPQDVAVVQTNTQNYPALSHS